MKILTYLLGALLAAALGAAALFYFTTFEPLKLDYERMKAGLPELEKARGELRKYKETEAKETQEAAWIPSAVAEFSKNLSEEIKSGKVEVAAIRNGVAVNISEDIMYTPRSVTFSGKNTLALLERIAASLNAIDLKDKEVIIGNTTDPVPATGRGRKKTPPKDARTLAAERSKAVVKNLEQNKVDEKALTAAAYSSAMPDNGFQIKNHKTVILVRKATAPAAVTAKPQPQAGSGPEKAEQTPKTIPLNPKAQ